MNNFIYPHGTHYPPTPFTPSIVNGGNNNLYVSYGIIFGPKYPNTSWHQMIVPTLNGDTLVNWQTDSTTPWPYIPADEGILCVRLRRSGLQFDEAIIDIYDPGDVVDDATYTFIPLATISKVTIGGNDIYLIDRHVWDNIMYQPSWRWAFECVPYTSAGNKGVLIQYGIIYDSLAASSNVPKIGTTALVTDITSNFLQTHNSSTREIYFDVEVDDTDEWEPIYVDFVIAAAATMPADTATQKRFLLATHNPTTDTVTQTLTGNLIIDRDGQSGSPYYLGHI